MTTPKQSKPERRFDAHLALLDTIEKHLAVDRGSVPCMQRGTWRDWTSSHPAALNRAAAACRTCPALEECRTYATRWETRGAGVWAGKIRGRRDHTTTEQTTIDPDLASKDETEEKK